MSAPRRTFSVTASALILAVFRRRSILPQKKYPPPSNHAGAGASLRRWIDE